MTRTNAICRAIAKRHVRLTQPGTDGAFTSPAYRSAAYPLRKDVLAISDPDSMAASVDDELMAATFVVSTVNQDRDGDIVIPQGFRLGNFRRNPVWFFSHQAIILPIGTSEHPQTKQLAVRIEPDQRVIATCFFDSADPDAVWIYGKVKRGFLRMTSIGFMPIRGERLPEKQATAEHAGQMPGFRFDEIDLLEISIVGVPANAEAMRIEAGDKVSMALRKSIDLMMPEQKAWSMGVDMKTKADATVATAEGSQDTHGEVNEGSDIQAISLAKKFFPTKPDAEKWVENHDLETTNSSETTLDWVFTQFEAKLCRASSDRSRQMQDGVTAFVCQRLIEEEGGAQEGVPPATLRDSKGNNMAKLVNGKIVKDEMKPEEPGKEGAGGETQEPHGKSYAKKSSDLMRQYYDLVEHPEMVKCMQKHVKDLKTHAMKAYPDDFDEKDFPQEPESSEPEKDDAADDEPKDDEKKAIALLKKRGYKIRKDATDPSGGLGGSNEGGEVDPVGEAAEYLENHAEVHKSESGKSDYHACMYHALKLKSVTGYQEDPPDEDAGGETGPGSTGATQASKKPPKQKINQTVTVDMASLEKLSTSMAGFRHAIRHDLLGKVD